MIQATPQNYFSNLAKRHASELEGIEKRNIAAGAALPNPPGEANKKPEGVNDMQSEPTHISNLVGLVLAKYGYPSPSSNK